MSCLEIVSVCYFEESGVMLVPWTYLTLYQVIVNKGSHSLACVSSSSKNTLSGVGSCTQDKILTFRQPCKLFLGLVFEKISMLKKKLNPCFIKSSGHNINFSIQCVYDRLPVISYKKGWCEASWEMCKN